MMPHHLVSFLLNRLDLISGPDPLQYLNFKTTLHMCVPKLSGIIRHMVYKLKTHFQATLIVFQLVNLMMMVVAKMACFHGSGVHLSPFCPY